MSHETKGDYVCPLCGAPLSIWADIAAVLNCQVGSDGQFKNPYIYNYQKDAVDAHCACTECDWRGYSKSCNHRDISELFVRIGDKAKELRLMEDSRSETQTLGLGGEE